jgi:hypothetical protein
MNTPEPTIYASTEAALGVYLPSAGPEAWLEIIGHGDMVHTSVITSAYHDLLREDKVIYSPGWHRLYQACSAPLTDGRYYRSYLRDMRAFVDWLIGEGFVLTNPLDVQPLKQGEDALVNYTYNWENIADHDIQYLVFRVVEIPERCLDEEYDLEGDEEIALLQVHLGGDARANLSAPIAYRTDYQYLAMFGQNAVLYHTEPSTCHVDWYCSDGYGFCAEWNGEGDNPRLSQARLQDYRLVDARALTDYTWQMGERYVDDDGLHCPLCGALLAVGL